MSWPIWKCIELSMKCCILSVSPSKCFAKIDSHWEQDICGVQHCVVCSGMIGTTSCSWHVKIPPLQLQNSILGQLFAALWSLPGTAGFSPALKTWHQYLRCNLWNTNLVALTVLCTMLCPCNIHNGCSSTSFREYQDVKKTPRWLTIKHFTKASASQQCAIC